MTTTYANTYRAVYDRDGTEIATLAIRANNDLHAWHVAVRVAPRRTTHVSIRRPHDGKLYVRWPVAAE